MKTLSKIKHGTELRVKKDFAVIIQEDVIRRWEEVLPEGTLASFGSYSRARERPPDKCWKEEFFTYDEMELGRLEPATVTVVISGEPYSVPKEVFEEYFEILAEEAGKNEILRS